MTLQKVQNRFKIQPLLSGSAPLPCVFLLRCSCKAEKAFPQGRLQEGHLCVLHQALISISSCRPIAPWR